MTKRINKKQVLATLHELVKEFGEDYTYEWPERFPGDADGPSCFYANSDGSPSCVAGHVFSRLTPELYAGIRDREEVRHRSFSLGAIDREKVLITVNGDKKPIQNYLTKGAIEVLALMQSQQDAGIDWGPALANTEESLS